MSQPPSSPISIRAAIEGEVEKALLAAGCIKASNFGELSKLGWTRSSRTDRGVRETLHTLTLRHFGFCGIPSTLWIDIHMLISFFGSILRMRSLLLPFLKSDGLSPNIMERMLLLNCVYVRIMKLRNHEILKASVM